MIFTYDTKTEQVWQIHVRNGGSGYAYPPKVRIIGDGFGAEAEAIIDSNPIINDKPNPNFGKVTHIEVTSNGYGYTETPIVELYGGFGLDRVLIEANATATVITSFSLLSFMPMVFFWKEIKLTLPCGLVSGAGRNS